MGKTYKKEKDLRPKGNPDLHKSRGQDWYNERFLPDVFDEDYDIELEEYINAKTIHPEEKPDK